MEGKTMAWILNSANKPIEAAIGSPEQVATKGDWFLTYELALQAQRQRCKHETKLGHSGTGRVFCADCRKPFN